MCGCICGWLKGDVINGEVMTKAAGCAGAKAGQPGGKHCHREPNGCNA